MNPADTVCLLEGDLSGYEEGDEHHEGEHVEANVVVPLSMVHLTPKYYTCNLGWPSLYGQI